MSNSASRSISITKLNIRKDAACPLKSSFGGFDMSRVVEPFTSQRMMSSIENASPMRHTVVGFCACANNGTSRHGTFEFDHLSIKASTQDNTKPRTGSERKRIGHESIGPWRTDPMRIDTRRIELKGIGPKISPRKYSIAELQHIACNAHLVQEYWTATLQMAANYSLTKWLPIERMTENKTPTLEPVTPRILPLGEAKSVELAGSPDDGETLWLPSPVVLPVKSTTKPTSVISSTDENDFYFAEDRKPRIQSSELITPTMSFETESIEHLTLPASVTADPPIRTAEPVIPPNDSDMESLQSVSEPTSEIGSWVLESSVSELEEQLREKTKLAIELVSKLDKATAQYDGAKVQYEKQMQDKSKLMRELTSALQKATVQRDIAKVQHEKQLQEKSNLLQNLNLTLQRTAAQRDISKARQETQQKQANEMKALSVKLQANDLELEELKRKYDQELPQEKIRLGEQFAQDNTVLIKSLESLHEKNLESLKANGNQHLHAAEEKRLFQLAEVEKKIRKCDEIWAADRKSLIAKLNDQTKSVIILAGENSLLRVKLALNEQSDRAISEHGIAGYNELSLEATRAKLQLGRLAKSDRRWVADVLEREYESLTITDIASTMRDLRSKLFSMETPEKDRCELEMLQNIKIPALKGKISGLQQLAMNIKADNDRNLQVCIASNGSIAAQYFSLSKQNESLKAELQRAQAAQTDLEPPKNQDQQMGGLSLSIENIEKAPKACYHALDSHTVSTSSPATTTTTTTAPLNTETTAATAAAKASEKIQLESRLEAADKAAKRARRQAQDALERRRDLMLVNYRLKRANVKLARDRRSAAEAVRAHLAGGRVAAAITNVATLVARTRGGAGAGAGAGAGMGT